jgi:hypothetical protein
MARIGHVPGEGDCYRGIRLRVWGTGKNSRALQVDLISTTPSGPWGACAADWAYPASQDVRAVIDYALEQGWKLDEVGGTFRLSEAEHGATFALADFVITDRLGEHGTSGSAEVPGVASDLGEFY